MQHSLSTFINRGFRPNKQIGPVRSIVYDKCTITCSKKVTGDNWFVFEEQKCLKTSARVRHIVLDVYNNIVIWYIRTG